VRELYFTGKRFVEQIYNEDWPRFALAWRGALPQNVGNPAGRADVSKSVKVQIYDQTYNIGGELEEAYVNELAAYVDAKMRAVAEATHSVDSLRVAVLAALAIADELHSLRQAQSEETDALRERAKRCLNMVERALKQSAG
jgi:cell division protein ZapA